MSFPTSPRIPQALPGVNSHIMSGDPGGVAVPRASLDPRSPSDLAADLYVDGRFWATVQLPARSPLATLAHVLSTESYRQSWQPQHDTIALDAAWTHLSLHLCRPLCHPADTEAQP